MHARKMRALKALFFLCIAGVLYFQTDNAKSQSVPELPQEHKYRIFKNTLETQLANIKGAFNDDTHELLAAKMMYDEPRVQINSILESFVSDIQGGRLPFPDGKYKEDYLKAQNYVDNFRNYTRNLLIEKQTGTDAVWPVVTGVASFVASILAIEAWLTNNTKAGEGELDSASRKVLVNQVAQLKVRPFDDVAPSDGFDWSKYAAQAASWQNAMRSAPQVWYQAVPTPNFRTLAKRGEDETLQFFSVPPGYQGSYTPGLVAPDARFAPTMPPAYTIQPGMPLTQQYQWVPRHMLQPGQQ